MTAPPPRRFDFLGDNARAYNSREPEILLAGAAGTGKSICLLVKCLTLLGKYPGCRGLFCRGTRASLTQSGLVSWEDDVLGRDHPVLVKNPVKRRVRQSYEFANGSEFVVAGLDDPGKTLSAQYDFVFVQEATEEGVGLDVYETLLRLLRNGRTPFTQVMMDCNPTTPTHWLYKRACGGPLKLYSSAHKDNPRFYDRRRGEWTEAGRQYLATLGRMTGARRKRFLEGVWAAAEGLVYDGYNPAVHLLPAGWKPPAHWIRFWTIDWGFVNPTVLQFWAIDPDGRLYLYREVYRTGVRAEQLAKRAKAELERGEPWPAAVVCDHDPDCQATFEAHTGLSLTPADKVDKVGGIEQLQARLDAAADGRPRVFFAADARADDPDPVLVGAGKPTSTLEEFAGYVWDTSNPDRPKDVPVDKNNHGCDAARYGCRWADAFLDQRPAECYAGDADASPFDSLHRDTFR